MSTRTQLLTPGKQKCMRTRKKNQQQNLLVAYLLPQFLATEQLQRTVLKNVKKVVLGLFLLLFVHSYLSLNIPFFPQKLRWPHLNNDSSHLLGTYYESGTELINTGRFSNLSAVMWQRQDGTKYARL